MIPEFIKRNKWLAIIIIALLVGFIIYAVSIKYIKQTESIENVSSEDHGDIVDKKIATVLPEPHELPGFNERMGFGHVKPSNNKAIISPDDLLPINTEANQFDVQFPQGMNDLSNKNFLTTGFDSGINTISSSRKNANLQLRSDPPIPSQQVGPWNQSTITPDVHERVFEIGKESCK